jgi:hypothetical protein
MEKHLKARAVISLVGGTPGAQSTDSILPAKARAGIAFLHKHKNDVI